MVDITKPVYGTVWADAGEKLSPIEEKIQSGWVQEMMPYQYENFLQNRQDVAITYLFQKGVPEWSSEQEYIANKSVVTYAGQMYMALLTNTNTLPTVSTSWKRLTINFAPNGAVPISFGGTGATSAADARANLGIGTVATANFPVTNGLLVKLSDNTLVTRAVSGTAGYITVTNGDGTSGNPIINVGVNVAKTDADASWSTTGSIKLPSGSTSEQGIATPGRVRFNLETDEFQGAYSGGWNVLAKPATAAQTPIVDTGGYYSSTNVEGALQYVGETLSNAVLAFPDYTAASAAAATLPDGQEIESPDAQGRLSQFKVQSGALVFNEYVGDRIGAAVWTEGQYRTMKERARDTYCILDGPGGADPTGNNDSTVAIREAIKSGARVEVPTGIFVWDAAVDPLGIVMTTPGQTLFGHGSGIAPGGLSEWGPARAFASRIMFTGTGQRLERTRREWRGSASDPTDPLMSAGVSVSAYGVNLENIAIDLMCDYTDMGRYNYGEDWDIAIHNMCWMGYREHNVATTGYWRRYGRLIENTALTRHISLPGYPVADWAIRGTDHTSLIFPYSRGPRVAIGVLGAKKNITGYDGLNPIFAPNYYDTVDGLVPDNRGSTGASDVSLHAPILFSAEHHSGWRVHEPRSDLNYTLEPDTAAACLHVDGWANNALETRDEVNQGLTVSGRARFHTIEAFHIRLDRCNRIQLEGHVDYSGYSQYPDGTPVGNKSYGSVTGTINTRNVTLCAGWMSNPQPEYFSDFVRGWYNLSPETGNAVHRNINLNELRQRDDGSASTHLGIRKRDTSELHFKGEDNAPHWRFSTDWIFEPYTDLGHDIGRFSRRVRNMFAQTFRPGSVNGPLWTSGSGSPEGVLAAAVGSMYTRTDGGVGTTLYVKQSGTGNTGWAAK